MNSLPRQFKILFILIIMLASAILVSTYYFAVWTKDMVLSLAVFGLLAIVSESLPVALPQGGYVTVSYAIFFAALILFPPAVFLSVVALAGLLVISRPGFEQPLYKRLFNSAQYVVSIYVVYEVVKSIGISVASFDLKSIFAYFLIAFTFVGANLTIVAVALGMLSGKSPLSIWVSNIRWSIPNFLALSPLGLLMALVFKNYGTLGLVLLSIPLLFSRHSFQRYMDMRDNYLSTIQALVTAIEAKDKYTRGHSERVAKYSVAIAEGLKLEEDEVESIRYMAVLHDVGKIGINENIINKTSKLSDWEWEAIRTHPIIGEDIVKNIKFLHAIGPGVRHHHERYDGTGYPDGLKGEQIPLEARIIAVADSFDAMTSDRSYRKGRSPAEALQELRAGAGTQFDPNVVEAFLQAFPDLDIETKVSKADEVLPYPCIS